MALDDLSLEFRKQYGKVNEKNILKHIVGSRDIYGEVCDKDGADGYLAAGIKLVKNKADISKGLDIIQNQIRQYRNQNLHRIESSELKLRPAAIELQSRVESAYRVLIDEFGCAAELSTIRDQSPGFYMDLVRALYEGIQFIMTNVKDGTYKPTLHSMLQ